MRDTSFISISASGLAARVPADPSEADRRRRAERDRVALANLAAMALDRHPGAWAGDPAELAAARAWRDEIAEALGLRKPRRKRDGRG